MPNPRSAKTQWSIASGTDQKAETVGGSENGEDECREGERTRAVAGTELNRSPLKTPAQAPATDSSWGPTQAPLGGGSSAWNLATFLQPRSVSWGRPRSFLPTLSPVHGLESFLCRLLSRESSPATALKSLLIATQPRIEGKWNPLFSF